MIKILFVCHGNICRSPMAEFAMKELVKKAGIEDQFQIASAATSAEEVGNPVYPPARRKLAEHGISCAGKTARQVRKRDYADYDLLIGMDQANIRNLRQICGGDPDGKIHLLLEYAGGGRSLVYRGFRGHLAGCSGGMPRDTQGAGGSSGTGKLIVLRQKVSITSSFKFDGSVFEMDLFS